MTVRRKVLLAAAVLAAPLAACNAPSPGAVLPGAPPAAPSSASAAGPGDSGCAAVVSKYRAVVENDISMGHVNPKVYDQIRGEINEADAACAAGQDGQALSLVRASKAKHGYPG